MTKKEIIEIVNKIINDLDTKVFAEDENKKDKIGCNQFRELSSLCRNSECYSEIELLVRYNEAKASPNSSWKKKMKNQKSLASCILDGMSEIKTKSDSEKDCMENLCLYYGYLYWNARIFAARNKEDGSQGYPANKNNKYNNKNNKY